MNARHACVLLSIALGACKAGAAPAATVVTDSAGVRVVTHLAGPRDTVRVGAPLLTIGEEGDSLYEFATVRFVGGLADGRVVVANRGSWQLRFYSPEGTFLDALGSAGDGPGEFRSMDAVQLLAGDTLRVHDVRLARVSTFSPEPAFVGSTSYAAQMGEIVRTREGAACVPPQLQGSLTDGTLVLWGWTCWPAEGSDGVRAVHTEVLLLPPDAAPARELGTFHALSVYERTGVPAPNQFTGLPMFGTLLALPAGTQVLLAHPGAHALEAYRPDGTLSMVIRDQRPRRAVDEAVRAARESELESAPPQLREILSGLPYPDSLPAFDRLLTGDGSLWARHSPVAVDDPETLWSVYARTGERLGTVSFPNSFTLHSVSGGRAFGVGRGALGVERIEVFPLPAQVRAGNEAGS